MGGMEGKNQARLPNTPSGQPAPRRGSSTVKSEEESETNGQKTNYSMLGVGAQGTEGEGRTAELLVGAELDEVGGQAPVAHAFSQVLGRGRR